MRAIVVAMAVAMAMAMTIATFAWPFSPKSWKAVARMELPCAGSYLHAHVTVSMGMQMGSWSRDFHDCESFSTLRRKRPSESSNCHSHIHSNSNSYNYSHLSFLYFSISLSLCIISYYIIWYNIIYSGISKDCKNQSTYQRVGKQWRMREESHSDRASLPVA